ncbi:MAG: TIR domain-containing protein, partial [Hyphomicrobiales bacterium]
MARRVFFSFEFKNDIVRANQVRNAWQFGDNLSPMVDKAGWEKVKAGGDTAIKRWIDNAISGCGVTCVLIGQQTHARPWVRYEIAKSFLDRKGVFGVCLRGMQNFEQKSFLLSGPNPFEATRRAYSDKYAIPNYPIYSWRQNNGRAN